MVKLRPICKAASAPFVTLTLVSLAACATHVGVAPPQAMISEKPRTLRAERAPIPMHIDLGRRRRGKLHPYKVSPGPPEGDTNDECTTIPTGWECVIQNSTNTDTAFYWPNFPPGATVTWSAPPTTNGVTFTPATFTTSTAPYQYNLVETAAPSAPVGNQHSASGYGTISGPPSYCNVNYCGSFVYTLYFQVSCALSLNHCPILDVTDTDLKKVVSATPLPSPTDWVVGLRKDLKAAIRSGSGSGTYVVVSTTWTAPAGAVASYTFGADKTVAPSPLTHLSGTSLQFYWTFGNKYDSEKIGCDPNCKPYRWPRDSRRDDVGFLLGEYAEWNIRGRHVFAHAGWQIQFGRGHSG
jgi:hypothetical protein